MVDIVGGPINFRPNDPYPGLTNFSLISHGFGNPSISVVLSLVKTYFQELISVCEGINHHSQSSFPALVLMVVEECLHQVIMVYNV